MPAEGVPLAGGNGAVANAGPAPEPGLRRDETSGGGRREQADSASLGEGVVLVRRVLSEAPTPPRWPMYPRQFKQFLRAAVPSFDERKYGSIAELMRACQKDGLLKLERDRQGGLRVFAGAGGPLRGTVPIGWSLLTGGQAVPGLEETGEGPERRDDMPPPAPASEFPDDDIGNRISGGAVDVTRQKVGDVGTRTSPRRRRRGSRDAARVERVPAARCRAAGAKAPQPRHAQDRGSRKTTAKRAPARRKRE